MSSQGVAALRVAADSIEAGRLRGWGVICDLSVPEKEDDEGMGRSSVATGKRQKNEVPKSVKMRFSWCSYLRKTRGVGVKITEPLSSKDDKEKSSGGDDKGKVYVVEEPESFYLLFYHPIMISPSDCITFVDAILPEPS